MEKVVLGGYDTRSNQTIVSDVDSVALLYFTFDFSFFLSVSHARPTSPICFPTPGDSRSDEHADH